MRIVRRWPSPYSARASEHPAERDRGGEGGEPEGPGHDRRAEGLLEEDHRPHVHRALDEEGEQDDEGRNDEVWRRAERAQGERAGSVAPGRAAQDGGGPRRDRRDPLEYARADEQLEGRGPVGRGDARGDRTERAAGPVAGMDPLQHRALRDDLDLVPDGVREDVDHPGAEPDRYPPQRQAPGRQDPEEGIADRVDAEGEPEGAVPRPRLEAGGDERHDGDRYHRDQGEAEADLARGVVVAVEEPGERDRPRPPERPVTRI